MCGFDVGLQNNWLILNTLADSYLMGSYWTMSVLRLNMNSMDVMRVNSVDRVVLRRAKREYFCKLNPCKSRVLEINQGYKQVQFMLYQRGLQHSL